MNYSHCRENEPALLGDGAEPAGGDGDGDPSAETPAAPGLIIDAPAREPLTVEHSIIDPSLLTQLSTYLAGVPGHLIFTLVGLPEWNDGPRYLVLQLILQFRERARVRVGQTTYPDAFGAVLAALVGTRNLAAHAQSLKAAKEAAALFHPDAIEAAAGRINGRLEELGATKVRATTLVKEIRQLAGSDGAAEVAVVDAVDAARGYLEALRGDHGLAAGQPPLRSYRSVFYEWAGTHWHPLDEDAVAARVTGWLQEHGVPRIGKRLVQDVLVNLRGLAGVRVDATADMPFYVPAPGEATPPGAAEFLVFSNGMVPRGAALSGDPDAPAGHDPRWFNRTVLPFAYDPAARCPRWRQFLNQALPRTGPGDRRQLALQAFVGYCLLSDCRFDRMLILLGNGSNGKSVCLKLIARLLGEANVEHIAFDQLTDKFRLTSLAGKSANVSMELNHMGKANEAQLRSIISGEPQTVPRKFLGDVKVTMSAKLMAGTNELPGFTDPTEATWRRLLIVPFEVTIGERDANRRLVDELAEELPGIFNWAARGLRRLLRKNRFPSCAKCDAALAGHRRDSDSVREFLGECCVAAAGWEPTSQPLFEVYRFYCEQRGRRAVAENEFGRRMKRAGWNKARGAVQPGGSRPWVYRGLRIKPEAEWVVTRYAQKQSPGWQTFPYASTRPAAVRARPGTPRPTRTS